MAGSSGTVGALPRSWWRQREDACPHTTGVMPDGIRQQEVLEPVRKTPTRRNVPTRVRSEERRKPRAYADDAISRSVDGLSSPYAYVARVSSKLVW